jgi:hypothetical protein
MIRRLIAAALIAAGLTVGGAGIAFADPDFGAGSSSAGPHDANAKCHPPGQTSGDARCK